MEVGVRTGRALVWENWDPVVKGPVSMLHPCGGRVMESPDKTKALPSHRRRIDCFRGGETGMRQGWRHGVLLGEGRKAQRRQMRTCREDDEDELALEAISGGGARGGEREESEITLRRET